MVKGRRRRRKGREWATLKESAQGKHKTQQNEGTEVCDERPRTTIEVTMLTMETNRLTTMKLMLMMMKQTKQWNVIEKKNEISMDQGETMTAPSRYRNELA